jgi:hypothetical protein
LFNMKNSMDLMNEKTIVWIIIFKLDIRYFYRKVFKYLVFDEKVFYILSK